MAATLNLSFSEQYAFQRGSLRLAPGVDWTGQPMCMAAWQGKRLSVMTHIYGTSAPAAIIDLFSDFSLGEVADGEVTLIPEDGTETRFEDLPVIAKEVPDLGLLVINALTPQSARLLPSWGGTAVRGGELFVADTGEPRMRFVLVNQSSVTTIMPRHALLGRPRFVEELAELDVSWHS